MVRENSGGQGGGRELGQRAVGLNGDFVDICADDDDLGIAEQHFDGLDRLPERQASWDRRTGGGHQRPVQPVNVQRQVHRAFDGTKRLKPCRPSCGPVVRVLRGFGQERGDAIVTLHTFSLLFGVRSNARLQQPTRPHVEGPSGRTSVRKGFAIKGGAKVSVGVKLHQCEFAQVTVDLRMVSCGMNERWKNAVLAAQKQREHGTRHEPASVIRHLIQLLEQGRHGTLPNRGGVKGQAGREVLAKFRIVQFDLPAGFDASGRTVGRALSVGRGELVGQRDDDHVGCFSGWADAQKGALDERRFHSGGSNAPFFILPMGRCPSGRCKRCGGGIVVEHLIWVGDQYNIATATQKWPLGLVRGDGMGMTLGELTRAIQQHIDLDMDTEVAQGMAEHALGFFGFYNRIIDNALEPTDRNLFYMFQDYDLLTTESEETTLWDGREWRIHYWKFKPDLRERVEAYMQRNLQEEEVDPFADIYSSDGASIWVREDEKVTNPNAFTSDW